MNRLQTPKEHATAVVWILAIVDEMIAMHARAKSDVRHLGLCPCRSCAVRTVCRERLGWSATDDVQHSMQALMVKHIRPKRSGTYWFGHPSTSVAWKRRAKALQKLRAIVAAGDINPYGKATP